MRAPRASRIRLHVVGTVVALYYEVGDKLNREVMKLNIFFFFERLRIDFFFYFRS